MEKPSATIFEENYNILSFDAFARWLFSFKLNYWDYVSLKQGLINIHKDNSTEIASIKTLHVLIEATVKKELDSYIEATENKISAISNEEKLELLKIELSSLKSKISDEYVIQGHEILKDSVNIVIVDQSNSISHPLAFYHKQFEHIEALIRKYEYEIFIYSTPIIQRLYQSLRDFEFIEWCERVLQEAPRNKLQYFVSMKSDIQRWIDDDKRKGENANFFDVTRLRVWDENHKMHLGPMNNYLSFLNWLNLQIEQCQKNGVSELETMQLNNHKKLTFTEKIYKNHLVDDIGYFDISTKDFAQSKDFKENSTLSNDNYIKAFAKLMAELPHSKRKKFIEHQLNLRENKEAFLEEVLDILNDYEEQFNLYDKKVVPEYRNIIENSFAYFISKKNDEINISDSFDKNVNGNKTPVIYLPENFKLTSKETNLKISTLDIYQTSLLFSYLREKGIVLNYSNSDLAKFAYFLTGHSEKNIATDKGFSSIEWIKQDKCKNKNFAHKEDYNLTSLKDALQGIIQEIETEIELNKKRKK